VRDAAILILAFAAALRSAELVGLDLESMGSTLMGCTGALILDDDETMIELATSKAKQLTMVEIVIANSEMPSLRLWLDRWLALAGVAPGTPVFRPIVGTRVLPRRLASEAVRDIVRRRLHAYALATGKRQADALAYAKGFSSHSGRRGYCTEAARKRVAFDQIRKHSRHASAAVLERYIADAEGRRSGGLKKVGF
jgi:integrase